MPVMAVTAQLFARLENAARKKVLKDAGNAVILKRVKSWIF